jgi:hypothetical protein
MDAESSTIRYGEAFINTDSLKLSAKTAISSAANDLSEVAIEPLN